MSPDVDLTVPLPGPHPLRKGFLDLDHRLFAAVAARHWPAATGCCPGLSRSANHGALWFAAAAAVAASRTPPGPGGPPSAASPRWAWPRSPSTPSASARCAAPGRSWTRYRWCGS
ncbi:hypothetical protein Sdagh_14690 [Streptomyces daghestanicus]|uniref:Uncharacterized protein n=1 Tax=Streptomyces daghestanicus TaxID=66885 RepID=A0ABQ3PXK5_9ACTN|nr:hypothetical protein Sdagh_14690 [Streptomyces daghestanicus]